MLHKAFKFDKLESPQNAFLNSLPEEINLESGLSYLVCGILKIKKISQRNYSRIRHLSDDY
jgi:hypothetical protein